MKSGCESIVKAILADDRKTVKALLKAEPLLGTAPITPARLYPGYHWIYSGDTPLHVAAAGYRVEIARLLLGAGADPNSARNHRRSTPLHYASDGHNGCAEWAPERQAATIRLLLEAGADLHAQDANGATALHRAVRTRSAVAVKTLLEAGADPAVRNLPGSTPFHLAVQNTGRGGSGSDYAKAAQREIIRLFLQAGVSSKLKDARGRSVSDWARSEWIRELLQTG